MGKDRLPAERRIQVFRPLAEEFLAQVPSLAALATGDGGSVCLKPELTGEASC